MEKIKFALRFVVLLAAVPVIMFTELTRKEGNSEPKRQAVENVVAKADEAMLNHSPFMQAVNN